MSDGIWSYRSTTRPSAGADLTGYKVETTDGGIGKVDKHSDDVASSFLVVDTGPWIFSRHVMIPAGTVQRIDKSERTIYVDLTRSQVKDAPEFDPDKHIRDANYHSQLGNYYQNHHGI
ncbi:PRC-barrel domain-containing protein [Streptomyces sp. NPDC006173]|uniref:PRC-barrel domain-containing protein n=1 Tax=Streptomyces sp. NPDC006173 TaxID=3155349 RepID=UPI0033E5F217